MLEFFMCFALVVAVHVIAFVAGAVAEELAKRFQPEAA
jgi:hypothetical protein